MGRSSKQRARRNRSKQRSGMTTTPAHGEVKITMEDGREILARLAEWQGSPVLDRHAITAVPFDKPAYERWREQWERDKQHIMLAPFELERSVAAPPATPGKSEIPASWSYRPWSVGAVEGALSFNELNIFAPLRDQRPLPPPRITLRDVLRLERELHPERYLPAHTTLVSLDLLDDDQPLTWEVYGQDGEPVEHAGTAGEYREMLESNPEGIYVHPRDEDDDQPDAGDGD